MVMIALQETNNHDRQNDENHSHDRSDHAGKMVPGLQKRNKKRLAFYLGGLINALHAAPAKGSRRTIFIATQINIGSLST